MHVKNIASVCFVVVFVGVLVVVGNNTIINAAFAATYQSNRQGYSIGYPNDWQVIEHFAMPTGTVFKPKLDTDPW